MHELFDMDCNLTHEALRSDVTVLIESARMVGVTQMPQVSGGIEALCDPGLRSESVGMALVDIRLVELAGSIQMSFRGPEGALPERCHAQ